MKFKKSFLWILFFGSLIGLNETFLGAVKMPYHSVVLSVITLTILSVARAQLPQKGTSLLIIIIALLYKINSEGVHSCTTNMLLCGPTALLLLGISYEGFASLFVSKKTIKYLSYALSCVITSLVAFSLFALMNTYILKSWDTSRLTEYIFIKGSLTAIASSVLSLSGIFLINALKNKTFTQFNPYVINGVLGSLILTLWLIGYFTT